MTGIEGFVGYYLARHLRDKGWAVYGSYFDDTTVGRILELSSCEIEKCDILDAAELGRIVREAKPDAVFHLAAISYVPQGGLDPSLTFKVNLLGSINLLEAVRSLPNNPRVVIAGSGEIYDAVGSGSTPLTETIHPFPQSFYGVSKYTMELAALRYATDFGMEVAVTRSFNHTGPGQRSEFVASNFALQIASIERDLTTPVMRVGNLDVVRDFTDVRDIVAAYTCLAEAPDVSGVFNVCSGTGVSIRWILEHLISLSGKEISVEPDQNRMRKVDAPVLIGSNKKLSEATGWRPTIRLSQTLEDLIDWWRWRVDRNQTAGTPR